NSKPTIILNADDVSGFVFNVDSTIPPTDVIINSVGNVVLNAPAVLPGTTNLGYSIYNPIGVTSIISTAGSLTNKSDSPHTPTIWTRTLDLRSQGAVGTSSSRLDVALVLGLGQTELNVQAG